MNVLFLILTIFLPVIAGVFLPIIGKKMESLRVRTVYVLVVCILTSLFSIILALGNDFEFTLWSMTESLSFKFGTDGLSRLFSLFIPISWTAVAFYAVKYMSHDESSAQNRFFAFYLIVLGMLCGLSYSSNLVTMYFCFEMMTLTSVPLVIHELTKEAIGAAFKYLFYSVAGAFMSLLGVIYIYNYGGGNSFISGGNVNITPDDNNFALFLVIIFISIIGFGAKAGMFPMHSWLTSAHPVAPAPASALLSGVILDTKNFVINAGSAAFETAAYLRKKGADTVAIRQHFADSIESYKNKYQLISNAKIYKECAIVLVQENVSDVRLLAAKAADELLLIKGVNASFVMYRTPEGTVNISARSFGKRNVQIIMEKMGGGGHHTMAAAQLKESSFEAAVTRLIEAIDE